jgi:hypothetical protein
MTLSSPPQTVIGTLFKRKLGKGKQGDRMVNALFTEDGRDLVIRRESGTAFTDSVFDALQGKRVSVSGVMQSFVLVISEVEQLPAIEEKVDKTG